MNVILMMALAGCLFKVVVIRVDAAEQAALQPLEHFFAESSRFAERLSPDGSQIAYLGPDNCGLISLWVISTDESTIPKRISPSDASQVTAFFWIEGKSLLWQTNQPGESPRLFLGHSEEPSFRQILAKEERRLQLEGVIDSADPSILVGLSEQATPYPDLYRVKLTGSDTPELVHRNREQIITWAWNAKGTPVAGMRWTADGAKEIVNLRDLPSTLVFRADPEDDARMLFASPNGSQLFTITNHDTDLTRVERIDIETGNQTAVASDPLAQVDVQEVLAHSGILLGVGFSGNDHRWKAVDSKFSQLLEALKKTPETRGMVCFGVDTNSKRCLLRHELNSAPGTVFLFDKDSRTLRHLWRENPQIDPNKICETEELHYPARDGTRIPAYLTVPREGSPPWPLVVFPHGGPRMRTHPGYDGRVQFLASRGYAVLQPNFRGSRGYGKAFMNAGDGQWGKGVMQTDVTDGVNFLITSGKVDKRRVAIFGGSYGGYAALAGLAFTPDHYAAGICLFGISDLIDHATQFSVESQAYAGDTVRRLGDPTTAEGRARLADLSPVNHATAFKAPLLIYHGAKDTLIPPSHASRMATALKQSSKPVTYLLAPTEAHGFSTPESEMAVYRAVEVFLHKHLGGKIGPPPAKPIARILADLNNRAK